MKVTLEESDSGEVVVIEQSSDGRITCVPARAKGRAANSAPRRSSKPEGKPRKVKDAPEEVEEAEVNADPTPEPEAAPKAAARPKSAGKTKPAKGRGAADKPGRRDTALTWEPVEDHDYHGFAAPSAAGQFKALITKGSQWALFYELKNTWPKHIGCFRTEGKAKERAQELHDAGWPESEFGPVTAGQVATACPAPSAAPRAKRKTKTETKEDAVPSTEEKPATPPAAEPARTDAEKDKELMASFGRELKAVLDEDEDD
ncbi:MAG: hypothetical protein JNK56_06335 [Myxococcales bacterium]|nr:hypothetical protein [Myxococcales bacterium]